MDIWVDKSKRNYQKLKKALVSFGAPAIPKEEFFGSELNVWGLGREPNRIEIMSEVKGLKFDFAFDKSKIYQHENINIRIIDFEDLMTAKKASGRFRDKNDIEQLSKKKKQ